MKNRTVQTNAKNPPRRVVFGQTTGGKRLLCGALLLGAWAAPAHAQGLVASADLSGAPAGSGLYNYTLTLTDSAASTSGIQTFWFAWQAGQADFLPSMPVSVQTPQGWNYVVEGGGSGDGYSIKFNTLTTPLAPGGSINFLFASPDPPKVMGGLDPLYQEFPVLASDVYSGLTSGIRVDITAQLVPEPPGWALFGLGAFVLAWGVRRNRPA